MARNIGILGTGMVGQAIAAKLLELGYQVMVGTRDVNKTKARREPSPMGLPPFSEWHKKHPNAKLGSFEDAARFGELILLCIKGDATVDAVKLAKPENFNGKTVIDISNPLDFSKGMPPSLITHLSNTNSVGEELQRALPNAHVVKSLNIVNCEVMVNAKKSGGSPTMFVAGNSSSAKEEVTNMLRQFGWEDILDLGDISGSRGMEMMLPIWLRIWGATKNGYIGFKIVR